MLPVSTACLEGHSPMSPPHSPCPPLLLPLSVLYIIYWCDLKLSAVVLGVCLVVLLTLTLNTVLHTVILLLLSFMVVSLTYIITKVVIDSFYNKKVHNPFKYVRQTLHLPSFPLPYLPSLPPPPQCLPSG